MTPTHQQLIECEVPLVLPSEPQGVPDLPALVEGLNELRNHALGRAAQPLVHPHLRAAPAPRFSGADRLDGPSCVTRR